MLSTGDALVSMAALASMIFVGRDHPHLLREGTATLEDARSLVASGDAKEFSGADVQWITQELRAIGLLMPPPDAW